MTTLLNHRDVMGEIVQFTGDRVVLWTLRNHLDTDVYNFILLHKRRILIYGQVQSGKTAAILDAIQKPLYDKLHKIIVIQNSLLVLKQYQQRLTEAGFDYQVIDHKTRDIHANIVILMNNRARYDRFLKYIKYNTFKYVLFMDEVDSYEGGSHPFAAGAIHEYYVTATPFRRSYKTPHFFSTVQRVSESPEYKGLRNVTVEHDDAPIAFIVDKFTRTDTGMLLINAHSRVEKMKSLANELTHRFRDVPIVLLTTERRIFYDGKVDDTYTGSLATKPISVIIDRLNSFPHIIFIANRMSLRGLSYCSSDYRRHLTHQYSDFRKGISVSNSLQRMRLLGKYKDHVPLKLIVPWNNEAKIEKMFNSLDTQFEISREFTI
jgi:hypothetical protein